MFCVLAVGMNIPTATASSEPGSINTAGASGTGNFGDSLSSAAGAALASLQKSLVVAEEQLMHKNLQLAKLQHQKIKLEQKLGADSTSNSIPELIPPPTPKNTPFFITPPLTPPNESLINNENADPGKPPKAPNKVCSNILANHIEGAEKKKKKNLQTKDIKIKKVRYLNN